MKKNVWRTTFDKIKNCIIRLIKINSRYFLEPYVFTFVSPNENRGILNELKPSTVYRIYMEVYSYIKVLGTDMYQMVRIPVNTIIQATRAKDDEGFSFKDLYCYPYCWFVKINFLANNDIFQFSNRFALLFVVYIIYTIINIKEIMEIIIRYN